MLNFFKITMILALVSGCSLPAERLVTVPTYQLWQLQSTTQSPLELAKVEAELGRRGQTKFGSSYIGKRTSVNYKRSLYSREVSANNSSGDIKNCSDFSNAATAQIYFLSAGGPVNDPNNLDADGDGFACEWGVQVRKSARAAQRPAYTPRPSYRSRCYTGPRGGTYTITASGRKNYDGC